MPWKLSPTAQMTLRSRKRRSTGQGSNNNYPYPVVDESSQYSSATLIPQDVGLATGSSSQATLVQPVEPPLSSNDESIVEYEHPALPIWSLAELQYNDNENIDHRGSFLLPIERTKDSNTYSLSGTILWTNGARLRFAQDSRAALSAEVLATTLAAFTFADPMGSNPISKEYAQEYRRINHSEDWSEFAPRVEERFYGAFFSVIRDGSAWPGRIAEVQCHTWGCTVPLGTTRITLIFQPGMSMAEVERFGRIQRETVSPVGMICDNEEEVLVIY
ncbi:hypothetical protein TREMEDRAFT_62631 [Tremella mesenterica DSM 1558]|uniref:uncharacterized protein n=1 Tax=Tremella mesenterica (strain ATCC 24925 / CBS 8224 / DSM 1558 / NBRC 9311 / NRRL Y-6157 / RJB 2259-6 / UBC 559-6) TaxID=578456 RepID=UPI0003F49570|nr:uncharacterized protein TREMEDRAFT_62631 [Tremella mesenterica DSM 1558]EIW68913.1 hypothetical protein TREMEDRAFT_62631 [Tremella mesenterica DSM 1558]